jgi:hypothetical protein
MFFSTNNLLQQGSPSCKVQYEKTKLKLCEALNLAAFGLAPMEA